MSESGMSFEILDRDPRPSSVALGTESPGSRLMFAFSYAPHVPSAEERVLDFFEDALSKMSPEEQERAVIAALAVEVRGKGPGR